MARKSLRTTWTISRYKRLVRPFVARVHSLTQAVLKDPLIVSLRLDAEIDKRLLQKLVKPSNATARLDALKPLLTEELFKALNDIFNIFKNLVNTLESSLDTDIPTLRQRCCYKIGKSMVLGSQTTYFKLNNSALFDADTLPPDIKRYNRNLAADIDGWLELEPQQLFGRYNPDIFMSYLLHLIIFNLQKLLYLLVPVLIHWLYEELIIKKNLRLKSILNYLFFEFWTFHSDHYYENIDHNVIIQLTGIDDNCSELFSWLYNIGYWDKFISSIGFTTERDGNQYELLLLDTLALNNKIYNHFAVERYHVYELLEKYPNHPRLNDILVCTLTTIINQIKEDPNSTKLLFSNLVDFISKWLSFSTTKPCLFNRFLQENEDLFDATISFNKYLYKQLNINGARELHLALLIMKFYFLELPINLKIASLDRYSAYIARIIIGIQKPDMTSYIPLKYSNYEVNHIIYWLINNDFPKLSAKIFHGIYGKYKRFYDPELQELYTLIH